MMIDFDRGDEIADPRGGRAAARVDGAGARVAGPRCRAAGAERRAAGPASAGRGRLDRGDLSATRSRRPSDLRTDPRRSGDASRGRGNERRGDARRGRGARGAGTSEPQPSQEELRARIEEQLRKVRVQDLLLESVVSVINLTARRIAKEDERDLEQARVGIEAVRALVDLLDAEPAKQVRSALSEVQMLYAQRGRRRARRGGGDPQARRSAGAPRRRRGAAERSAPRRGPSRLWTPPGTRPRAPR